MSAMSQQLFALASRVLGLWTHPAVRPDEPAALLDKIDVPVCYVLETGGLADNLVLEKLSRKYGLPSPFEQLQVGDLTESRRYVVMKRMRGFLFRRRKTRGSERLQRLVEASLKAETDLLLLPVGIYWGRAPGKDHSWFKLLFSEDWEVAGRTRKFFTTIFQGRNTLVRYSEPLSLQDLMHKDLSPSLAFRKASRILRVHFRQRRIATVGPDLSHRRLLLNDVLNDPAVAQAIDAESGDGSRYKAEQQAKDYVNEIAAHLSYPTIRVVERFLSWLWNRIYDGVEVAHIEKLHEVAKDHEVVYAPCHRSHIDYLLLSYIVYHQGLSLPHIAAGINLNMPIVGGILRRGGAFFLRRTFRGNRLYATVFSAYLRQILVRGHAIEYFVEGTRSRTGRLLAPKGGMLSMTVSAYMQKPRLPVVFVPVYFGYEKMIEGNSFISELSGAEKKKESVFSLLKTVKALRDRFGKVYVNIGEPIKLDSILDKKIPDWRVEASGGIEKPEGFQEAISELGESIMTSINASAAVTPISLLAYALLSSPKQSMGELELRSQLSLYLRLIQSFEYSELVTLPDMDVVEMIAHGEALEVIQRRSHQLGDVISMTEQNAVLMTYFFNNIQHLFVIPAAVACCFIHGRRLAETELQRLLKMIYPFIRRELSLVWPEEELEAVTRRAIEVLVSQGLLVREDDLLLRPKTGSAAAFQLLLLGQSMVPVLQRYYLVIALLVRNGSGVLTRSSLENLCQRSAQRLSMIYGLHSPDFFDKALFRDFIRTLTERKVVQKNASGFLEIGRDLQRIGEDARLVLGEQIRHSILSLTIPATEHDRR